MIKKQVIETIFLQRLQKEFGRNVMLYFAVYHFTNTLQETWLKDRGSLYRFCRPIIKKGALNKNMRLIRKIEQLYPMTLAESKIKNQILVSLTKKEQNHE